MITRIHGATSTLAANPGKKTRKAKSGKRHKKVASAHRAPRKTVHKAKAHKASAHKSTKRTAKRRASAKSSARKLFAVYRRAGKSATGKSVLPYRLARNPEQLELALEGGKKRGKKGRGSRSPLFSIYSAGKGKKRRFMVRRNPAFVLAGVPVLEMAIGSAATIAIGAVSNKLIAKFAPTVSATPVVGDIVGELATAAVAWALHDYVLKNPMHKSIAQYAFVGAVFQILSKKATPAITSAIEMIPGLEATSAPAAASTKGYSNAMSGVYFDPYSATPAVGGYVSADTGHMAGIYTDVNAMSGLGLFNAPSIYG